MSTLHNLEKLPRSVASVWALYALVCFFATTFGNVALNSEMFKELVTLDNEKVATSSSATAIVDPKPENDSPSRPPAQEHLICHRSESPPNCVVEPYGETFSQARLGCNLIVCIIGSGLAFVGFYAVLRHASNNRVGWSIAVIVLFSATTSLMFKVFPVGSLDDSAVVTNVVYASVLAVVYAVQKYNPRPTIANLEQRKAQIELNKLMLQAGFFIFAAFCVSLMWEFSKGTGERYKQAPEVYARLEQLINVRIAVHSTLISLGILGGVVARLLSITGELIRDL